MTVAKYVGPGVIRGVEARDLNDDDLNALSISLRREVKKSGFYKVSGKPKQQPDDAPDTDAKKGDE